MALELGREFAGYQIEAEIGRGGMGVVYRAVDVNLERSVALKVLPTDLASDDSFRKRFMRESKMAAAIDHPNIIPIYEAREADGSLYIAMRFVQGSDLKEIIKSRGGLDPETVISYLGQVASALDVAHAKGLVHRDVKPQNILVSSLEQTSDDKEQVYLTDFGLTKKTASATGITSAGQMVGTIDYIAPEQLSAGEVDGRADIYALGCVLYESLTGLLPFERDSDVQVMYAHINDLPAPVEEVRPELGSAIHSVVTKAMAKAPEDRYSSAREMMAAAREALRSSEGRSGSTAIATPGVPLASPSAGTQPGGPARGTVVGPDMDRGGRQSSDPAPVSSPEPAWSGGPFPTSPSDGESQPPQNPSYGSQSAGGYGSQPGYQSPPQYQSYGSSPTPYPGYGSQASQPAPSRNTNNRLFLIGGAVLLAIVLGIVGALALGGGDEPTPVNDDPVPVEKEALPPIPSDAESLMQPVVGPFELKTSAPDGLLLDEGASSAASADYKLPPGVENGGFNTFIHEIAIYDDAAEATAKFDDRLRQLQKDFGFQIAGDEQRVIEGETVGRIVTLTNPTEESVNDEVVLWTNRELFADVLGPVGVPGQFVAELDY